jgi:hypothetical protein
VIFLLTSSITTTVEVASTVRGLDIDLNAFIAAMAATTVTIVAIAVITIAFMQHIDVIAVGG